MVGSPLKKARASLPDVDEESLRTKFGRGGSGHEGMCWERLNKIRQRMAAMWDLWFGMHWDQEIALGPSPKIKQSLAVNLEHKRPTKP